MNPTDLDIAPEHLRIVRQILQQHVPQYEIRAFGSRVTGRAKPYSDLDLAVMTTTEPLPLQVHAGLAEAFSESDLPWKVDLVDWQLIGPDFRSIVGQQYIVLQAV